MTKSSQLKGAIFEWFVKKILRSGGFIDVEPDGDIIYNGSMGLMIHGLGHAHNADVLMSPPPFQIPFYFPSRLIVECKAYGDSVGLPIVRGILGMRVDINQFEILTPEILKRRRNYRLKNNHFPRARFSYQVALATVNKISPPGEEFALTHHIPILSLSDSTRYAFFRDFLKALDDYPLDLLEGDFDDIIHLFKEDLDAKRFLSGSNPLFKKIENFIEESQKLFNHMFVGVLESGELIFLYGLIPEYKPKDIETRMENSLEERKLRMDDYT